jgi:hypothetical protein
MSKRVVLVLLILASFGRGAVAQSLADVAKKEEERRKALPEVAKVYTNKDLTALPAGSPLAPPPAAATPAKPADAAKDTDKATKDKDGKDKEPPKDQAYWAGRLKALQDTINRDQTYVDALQTRINSLTADAYGRDDPVQRAALTADRQKSIAEHARLTKSIQDNKKAIADLQEEARRAGVPPGWLR